MAVSRFEDLIAWQKARELTKMIYRVSAKDEFQALMQIVNETGRVLHGFRLAVKKRIES